MQVSYYPGCSLEATARDYAESVAGVAGLLDIELVELPGWNCCGATAAHSLNHKASLNLAARNLALAQGKPQPLVVPCSLCFNRLKTAQHEILKDPGQLTSEIAAMGDDWAGVEVVELNRFLSSAQMIARSEEAQVQRLEGLRPVVYYGCQGQRPPKVTGHPQAENPQGLDRLLTSLGAQVRDWPFKTDCCGASHAVARPDIVHTLVARLYDRALAEGANCIVTGCQMCQANLDMYQDEIAQGMDADVYLPVFYFTELLGIALGHPQSGKWLGRHLVNPKALLSETGVAPQVWERL